MGDALEGSASQDADLRARLDQLEDMVRGLMARSDIGAVHFMPPPLVKGMARTRNASSFRAVAYLPGLLVKTAPAIMNP